VAGTDDLGCEVWDTGQVLPTVVIIDDSHDFLVAAAGLLNEEGFDVVGCVEDPAAAVDEVWRLRPSLVLLDIQFPRGNGFDLAEELARMEPRPIVVLTSSRDANSYGEALRAAPVRGFIAKRELSGEALATMV
jgi:DNA-binding NarL/FixJ family response regulator